MRIPISRYLLLLSKYLKPQWIHVILLAVSLLSGIGLQLIGPQIIQYFLNNLQRVGSDPTLIYAGGLFVLVALLSQFIAVSTSYLATNVAWTATNHLRNDLIKHCLALDLSFHKARTPGEMIERIDGDVDRLSNFFSQFVVSLLSNLILLVGVLVLFFAIHWLAGVVMTLFSVVVFCILLVLRRRVVPLWRMERQKSALFFGFLGEQLSGTEDIRANGATAYVLQRFYRIYRDWFPARRNAILMSNLSFAFTLCMFISGSALAIGLGLYLWNIHAIQSVGTIYVMFAYTDLLSQPIQQIQSQLQDLQQAEACIDRTEELLKTQSALVDGQKTLPTENGALSVRFEDVSFGYIAEEPVLHKLSFTLPAGRVLGVLGRTGSGKTTLARLIFRLYDPQQGTIYLNGLSSRELQLREVRGHIGMVTQDVQLFHATLRDNLTFFRRSIADEQILAALRQVGLFSWYQTLPDGLDTLLGSDGEGLSAGEAQLLAFTRVLLTKPGLIVLDEASSRLDPATETLIEQAIDLLFTGRSAIVIAHRLATLQRVDDILILEDGQIVEYGTRAQLAQDPTSRFSALLRTGLEDAEVLA